MKREDKKYKGGMIYTGERRQRNETEVMRRKRNKENSESKIIWKSARQRRMAEEK